MKILTCLTEEKIKKTASVLADTVRRGDVFALFGDLGMGKTVFSRAFIQAIGNKDEDVPSPTFTLVQTYDVLKADLQTTVWHFDLYRIKNPFEIYELGMEDAVNDICLIEWPQNALDLLPKNRLEIHFENGETATQRTLSFIPKGTWEQRELPL